VIDLFCLLSALCRGLFSDRVTLLAENLALRQQMAVYRRTINRPRLRPRDRIFWVWLSRLWSGWRSALIIVQPDTVARWHQEGFQLYWRWKSRSNKIGRPQLDRTVKTLLRRMCRENPLWGAPRIQAELALLGHDLSESTVAKYMLRPKKPSSPTWNAFLANHAPDIIATDFFVVPTATFRLLYCFLVLSHDRLHADAYHEMIRRSDGELHSLRLATPPPPGVTETWIEVRALATAYLEEETVSQSRVLGGGK
jgi:hypothetical protein